VFSSGDLLEALTGTRPEWATQVITEATVDSRQVIPGALFVALPGEHADGHDFVAEAFQRGATFAFIQREIDGSFSVLDLRDEPNTHIIESFNLEADKPVCLLVKDSLKALQQAAYFWRRKLKVRVIGITGSVGKSTTKELVAEVLSQRYRTLKSPGNLNNEIGLPLTLLSLSEGYERAILEMGFYVPGEIAFLCDLAQPVIGVLTNIGTVHAERAGTQDDIARGKAELVQALPPDGFAVLNYDDPWVIKMADLTQAQVFTYGMDNHANLWADNVEGLGLEGIRFRLHYGDEVLYIRVPLIGRHSVHTALRAAAVGLLEGLSWQEIVNGLRSGNTQLRLMAVRTEQGALVLDDTYNASPESMLAALNLLEELDGRKVAVLGDMLELGMYEWRGHEMVGIRASEVVERLFTVGERGRMIAAAACRAGLPSAKITELETTDQAIDLLKKSLEPQDVVLVKGSRGMHMDQIVAALEHHR
jgi:UDP-N-acetylmuramoyl-tripeptide--D-alanyl-D-alanine ligase